MILGDHQPPGLFQAHKVATSELGSARAAANEYVPGIVFRKGERLKDAQITTRTLATTGDVTMLDSGTWVHDWFR